MIATGARPRILPGLEPDGERIWTYFEAMTPKRIPETLLVVGAGAIGVEFASFYSGLGSKVVMVEMLPQILPAEDDEIAKFARAQFERQGIAIRERREGGEQEARPADGLLPPLKAAAPRRRWPPTRSSSPRASRGTSRTSALKKWASVSIAAASRRRLRPNECPGTVCNRRCRRSSSARTQGRTPRGAASRPFSGSSAPARRPADPGLYVQPATDRQRWPHGGEGEGRRSRHPGGTVSFRRERQGDRPR